MKAQAQATALVEQALLVQGEATPVPGERNEDAAEEPEPEESTPAPKLPAVPTMQPTATDSGAYQVELVNIGYAAEGNLIIVQFKATRKAVNDFWPGRLSVTDEATGTVYNEVPSMPVVGPLIGRPANPGQLGYVMFANTPPGLPPGSLVTVKLGKFEQKHVPVSKTMQ